MHYYSGFALHDEVHFFEAFRDKNAYCVSGFSYGAIKAFQYVLDTQSRVDRLQLFSPAFFQQKSDKFKRLQMMGYQKTSDLYIKKFTENCFLPYSPKEVSYAQHSAFELEELLHFVWKEEEIKTLIDRGVRIEVYLGSEDKISDVASAFAFFKPFGTVTLIKGANHFLQGE